MTQEAVEGCFDVRPADLKLRSGPLEEPMALFVRERALVPVSRPNAVSESAPYIPPAAVYIGLEGLFLLS